MRNLPIQSPPTAKDNAHPGTLQTASAKALLFLREDEMRIVQDTVFFAWRDMAAAPNAILGELGYGCAHSRCLYWLARRPRLNVSELLSILGIAKQSLSRVLLPLIDDGYVAKHMYQADRRQRLLTLTARGHALESRLYEAKRERILAAYREAGGSAVGGFKRVLRGLMQRQSRLYIDGLEHGAQTIYRTNNTEQTPPSSAIHHSAAAPAPRRNM